MSHVLHSFSNHHIDISKHGILTMFCVCSGTHFDGTTMYVNACTCTSEYRPDNPAIVIDLPLDPSLPAQVVQFLE